MGQVSMNNFGQNTFLLTLSCMSTPFGQGEVTVISLLFKNKCNKISKNAYFSYIFIHIII